MARVSGEALPGLIKQRVRLVGKVLRCDEKEASIELSPGLAVTITSPNSKNYGAGFVEVIGVVQSAKQVQELKSVAFDDKFDLATYNEMLKVSSAAKYDAMFRTK